ncbi:MAG: TetR/AcrR family transcriptional regulator [Coriobacteriales bacterium]|jgi:AcrR family transcriptional regulator|nr:TetR/AcrR family transcriptional regulator [Coriobacteriales bacterium]
MTEKNDTAHRRRGDKLEQAIFAATLRIAREQGYPAVTFAKVAEAAHTSRSVIYRHWPSPFELLYAAVIDSLQRDEGIASLSSRRYHNNDLRADLIQMLGDFSRRDGQAVALLLQAMHVELALKGQAVNDLITRNEENDLEIIDRILASACARGEIAHTSEQLPRQVRLLPFELVRYHAAFLRESITQERLTTLVDQVFLPLLRA